MNDKPLRERVSGMAPPLPVESAMPPRVPAPIRVDEEALKRSLEPMAASLARVAATLQEIGQAVESAVKALAEANAARARDKHQR